MKRASIFQLMVFLGFYTCNQVVLMGSETQINSPSHTPETAFAVLQAERDSLETLVQKINECTTMEEKLAYVSTLPNVKKFLAENQPLAEAISDIPPQEQYIVKAVIALNQGAAVFTGFSSLQDAKGALKELTDRLLETERFYSYMGGLVGYHVKTVQLMADQLANRVELDDSRLHVPPMTDIRKSTPERAQMIKDGLNSLDQMAELYVVGGAGDRLKLLDDKTHQPLPVARLSFGGYTLLEHLVRDLEAREALAYKLTGKKTITPIVLMTSHEKKNDEQITAIMEERGYFGRPKESIIRLVQPMTPVIAIDGMWAVNSPCELIMKPGGHGVVWKLADEYGIFSALEKQGRSYFIVRQINNPLAGLDANLLALAGFGYQNNKAFGFESVPRLPGMSEGMNIVKQKGDSYTISNIEYTEFAKAKASDPEFAKIADSPDFPANTNILFANIKEVQKASTKLPVAGFIVNMKHPVETLRAGKRVSLLAARLESTMQNIADAITTEGKEELSTFVLINDRAKTMSVTKKACDGKSIQETPEGCFYDLMQENMRMLKNYCNFSVPEVNSPHDYLAHGPTAIFSYHPALGPVYSIIGQKITSGTLAKNSEFQLEVSEVSIKNLAVDGSLLIHADQVTGHKNQDSGNLEFSREVGRLVFENVNVKNGGIDRARKNSYYKSQIHRKEAAHIRLLGNSECIAKNVDITGNFDLVVESGTRAILSQDSSGNINVKVEPLETPNADSLHWTYTLTSDNEIVLKRT